MFWEAGRATSHAPLPCVLSGEHRDFRYRSDWTNGGFDSEKTAPFDQGMGGASSEWIDKRLGTTAVRSASGPNRASEV